ncbi:MAG: hypothetical protein QM775_17230 [Pirellulales bacterium]
MKFFARLISGVAAIGFGIIGPGLLALGLATVWLLFAAVHWWVIAVLVAIVAFAAWGLWFGYDRAQP